MEKRDLILELIDRYWKFDNEQEPITTLNDKQDLLRVIEIELEQRVADTRNKLSPIKNLLALLEKEYKDIDEGIDSNLLK